MRAARLAFLLLVLAAPSARAEPERITEYRLPPEKMAEAETLYRIRTTVTLVSLALALAAPIALLELRVGPRYRDLAERIGRRRFVQALVFVPLLFLTLALVSLPLDVYEQSVMREHALSVQGWGSWFGDWAKSQLVSYALAVPLVYGLYAIVRRSPARWWFHFWLLTVPVVVLLVFVSPILLDPLFNTFEPLAQAQPQLVEPIEQVAARGGLEIPRERLFEMKASDKVTTYNAYVTGLGATKRVVVWDNTARDLTTAETQFIFGHELGHYALAHVYQLVAFACATLLACFWLGHKLVAWLLARWGGRWGIRGVDDWASLPALILALTLVVVVAIPIYLAFSRQLEHQADIYALEVTHGLVPDPGQVGASAFQKLGEKVVAYPDPHPVLVWWSSTHPPLAERIRFIAGYDPWSAPPGPVYVK